MKYPKNHYVLSYQVPVWVYPQATPSYAHPIQTAIRYFPPPQQNTFNTAQPQQNTSMKRNFSIPIINPLTGINVTQDLRSTKVGKLDQNAPEFKPISYGTSRTPFSQQAKVGT